MTNHPNRGRTAKSFPQKIDVPKMQLGENRPLGRYIIRFDDGTEMTWQRGPSDAELSDGVNGRKIVAWAQYGVASGERLEVWSKD